MDKKRIIPNMYLLFSLLLLCFISCLAIKSAAPIITRIANPEDLWMKQFIFYAISFGVMYCVYKFGNHRIYSAIWIIYAILLVFLFGLVIERFALYKLGTHIIPFAKDIHGATRWYSFPGFDFQPSEFVKIVLIICVSQVIDKHNLKYATHSFHSDCIMIAKTMAITAPACILIFLQNDAGFTSLILISIIFILFSSGLQIQWFVVGGIILVLGIGIVTYIFLYQHEVFVKLIGSTYRMNRFYGWVDPEGTYSNQGFQVFNALISYGSAGIFGHGFQSTVILFPEAQTDFVFAVIAQNFGLIGGVLTILAIVLCNISLLSIGLQTKSHRYKYFISGIFGLLIFQQAWNIGMVMGAVPITGITLPLLSYGGSSLLSYMIAFGMCLDIDKQTKVLKLKSYTNYFSST